MQLPWQARLRSLRRQLSPLAVWGDLEVLAYSERGWTSASFQGISLRVELAGERGAFEDWSTDYFLERDLPLYGFITADIVPTCLEPKGGQDVVLLELLLLADDAT